MRILAKIYVLVSAIGLAGGVVVVAAFGVTTRPSGGGAKWKPSLDPRLLAPPPPTAPTTTSTKVQVRLPRRILCRLGQSRNVGGDDADNGADEFSQPEVQKMDDLILSLSLEHDDAQRRDKVAQVLGDKLLQPNGHGSSDRFMRLYEDRLTVIGNQVRNQAASEAQDNTPGVMVQGQPSETVGKQLWALVDMMIQSKVIFKQAKSDGLV